MLKCFKQCLETKTEIKPKRKIDPGDSTPQGSSPNIITVVITREFQLIGHESGIKL